MIYEATHTFAKQNFYVDQQRCNLNPLIFKGKHNIGSVFVFSVKHRDIKNTEFGSTGRAGDLAGQPGLRSLLILAAGEPSTQTGQTPHGSAHARLAI